MSESVTVNPVETPADTKIVEFNTLPYVMNAKLQQKKNALRKALAAKGVLHKGGKNTYDKYAYFTEAQYKELFTELFSNFGLELNVSEVAYDTFAGPEKQANGRIVRLRFSLIDIETGFSEESEISGEGIDKGDKAGYKAYTGALKYYLANTFMVATGDDPETESPGSKMNDKQEKPRSDSRNLFGEKADDQDNWRKATDRQIEILSAYYKGDNLEKLLAANNIERLEDMPLMKASELIDKLQRRGQNNG